MDTKKTVNQYRYLYTAALVLGTLLVAAFIYYASVFSLFLYWLPGTGLPAIALGIACWWRWRRLRILVELREQWGKEAHHRRSFQDIAELFEHCPGSGLDDQTWNDLNMDQLYAKIDRTLTNCGEAVLYKLLRTPLQCESKLQQRNKLIESFQHQPQRREAIQYTLHKLGREHSGNLVQLLWGERPRRSPYAPLFSLAALAALLSLFAPLLWRGQGVLLVLAMIAINSVIHYRSNQLYKQQIPAITELAALLRTAREIQSLDISGIEEYQAQLKTANRSTTKILAKTKFLVNKISTSDLDFIYEYLKIFFLLEARSFYAVIEEINRHVEHLQDTFIAVGTIDALLAVASFRFGEEYTTPKFINEPTLELLTIRHPLLSDPVANSIRIHHRGILITGSNMSGKSTFLRTVGINAVLAQTIYTCMAQSYTGCLLKIITSINKADDIGAGKSFYFAEAERLSKIISETSAQQPTLCLIDELLSGTNYRERLAASGAILQYLQHNKNALVLVATHDMDLADQLQDTYQCYHFTDKVDQSGLNFDFTLKEGVAKTRNAIKLLQYLGYPQEIIEQANTNVMEAKD